MKKVYIYGLSDPITNEIRYIGKTVNMKNRYKKHVYQSKYLKTKIGNWIKKLISINLKPNILLIEECEENNWIEREKYWIKKYKEDGYNLLNIHEGGNEPPKKKGIKKFTEVNGRFKVIRYKNDIYYNLGTWDTKEEAIKAYNNFDSGIILKETAKYHKGGVIQYKDGLKVNEFNSVSECAKFNKTSTSRISACCRGKYKTHKGFFFEYKPT